MGLQRRGIATLIGVGVVLGALILAAAATPTRGTAERADVARCFGERATIVATRFSTRGTAGPDVIVTRPGAGLIKAGGGADLICVSTPGTLDIWGERGDDRIVTGAGRQSVDPGTGDDRVRTGPGPDLLTDTRKTGDDRLAGGPGRDRIRFNALELGVGGGVPVEVDLAAGTSTGHGQDRLAGFEDVEGTFYGDFLTGDGADNVLEGVEGGDTIHGRGGDDLVLGSTPQFPDDPFAGPYDDPLLDGGSGDDKVLGRFGSDRLEGSSGDDLLAGGAQPQTDPRGDRGDGGPGTDRCRNLESERSC